MIPSLLQIPSAVSDSKLHSVLPNNGKGDFQFERSTGATRINRDGLIEEVGYFSSELVQNGNFSELGSELVVNGDFANWTNDNPNGWTTTGTENENNYITEYQGKARYVSDGSTLFMSQTILTSGKFYKVTADIVVNSGGGMRFQLGANGTHHIFTTTQSIVLYAQQDGTNGDFQIIRQGATDITIDNVSVKQVDPNDRWTLETGWSYGSNKITASATTTEIEQDVDLPLGKVYKATFTIEDYVSGNVRIRFRGTSTVNGTYRSGNGTYTEILTSTGHTNIKIDGNASFTGSVTNISVVEVQGDRPRLSYDITNGVVESQPHLLLEPSSTNLVTFSEDFTQSEWTKNNTSINSNNITAPDGTLTADKLIENTSNAQHTIYDNVAWTTGQDYSFSVFAKKGERNILAIVFPYTAFGAWKYASFNLDTGATITVDSGVTASIESLPNGWYRCIATATTNATTSADMAIKMQTVGSSQGESYQGDGSSGFYIWGAMLEQQAFSTSYIPTAGTTITRAAETCNNSKPSVNSTEGVLYAEIGAFISTDSVNPNRYITISDGTQNERVCILFGGNNNQIRYIAFSSSQSLNVSISDTTNDTKNFNKVAVVYKSGEYKMFINGSQSGSTNTASAIFSSGTLNTVNFDLGGGTLDFYGKVKGLAVYNEALTDAQLIELTS